MPPLDDAKSISACHVSRINRKDVDGRVCPWVGQQLANYAPRRGMYRSWPSKMSGHLPLTRCFVKMRI